VLGVDDIRSSGRGGIFRDDSDVLRVDPNPFDALTIRPSDAFRKCEMEAVLADLRVPVNVHLRNDPDDAGRNSV